MDAKKFLVEAKNKIIENGWCQGVYEDAGTGALCAMGALSVTHREMKDTDAYVAAYDALTKTIIDTGSTHGIEHWNDKLGRTEREVLDLFDHAAQIAGGR